MREHQGHELEPIDRMDGVEVLRDGAGHLVLAFYPSGSLDPMYRTITDTGRLMDALRVAIHFGPPRTGGQS